MAFNAAPPAFCATSIVPVVVPHHQMQAHIMHIITHLSRDHCKFCFSAQAQMSSLHAWAHCTLPSKDDCNFVLFLDRQQTCCSVNMSLLHKNIEVPQG